MPEASVPSAVDRPSIQVSSTRKSSIEMHEARQMSGRDAAELCLPTQKRRRNARRHRERIAERKPRDLDGVAHSFVHGQNRARKRAVVEPQAAVRARHAAALQIELIGPAGRRRHRIRYQHEAVMPLGGESDAQVRVVHMVAVCDDADECIGEVERGPDHAGLAAGWRTHRIVEMGERARA